MHVTFNAYVQFLKFLFPSSSTYSYLHILDLVVNNNCSLIFSFQSLLSTSWISSSYFWLRTSTHLQLYCNTAIYNRSYHFLTYINIFNFLTSLLTHIIFCVLLLEVFFEFNTFVLPQLCCIHQGNAQLWLNS